jgi:hypothetical protein
MIFSYVKKTANVAFMNYYISGKLMNDNYSLELHLRLKSSCKIYLVCAPLRKYIREKNYY